MQNHQQYRMSKMDEYRLWNLLHEHEEYLNGAKQSVSMGSMESAAAKTQSTQGGRTHSSQRE